MLTHTIGSPDGAPTGRATRLALGGLALLAGAVPLAVTDNAEAATLYMACAPPQYGNFRYHQTTFSWVRLGDRACVQWKSDGSMIRAMARLRADWPRDGCTISLPFAASCPLGRFYRDPGQVIRDITFTVEHEFASDGYKNWTIHCSTAKWTTTPLRGSVNTLSCYDGWNFRPPGSYRARAQITYRVGNQVFVNPWTPWVSIDF